VVAGFGVVEAEGFGAAACGVRVAACAATDDALAATSAEMKTRAAIPDRFTSPIEPGPALGHHPG
jgi:hypothetical protein